MTTSTIETTVRRLLSELRPEIDLDTVPRDADLREEMDIDSMDFLNFVIAVDAETGVEIPEDDYGDLLSLDDLVGYLEARASNAG
jgi:acyl carrier protein